MFFPCVEFLPSHPGKRLKFRSPGNAPNTSLGPLSALAGITAETMLAYGMSPQFCFTRTDLFMTSPSAMFRAALATSSSRSSSLLAANGR